MKLYELTGIKHLQGSSQALMNYVDAEFDAGRTKLFSIPKVNGQFWDIKPNNFAWRGSQLVVLDPIADKSSNILASKLVRLFDTTFKRR